MKTLPEMFAESAAAAAAAAAAEGGQNLPDGPLDSPVKSASGKKSLDAQTFLLTVSPKGDVSAECEKALLKWIDKNSLYCYVVFERGSSGKKHLHAALCFDVPRSKQRLQEDIWKFKVKKWHGDSVGRYAVVVTNMYNHDWYDSYLKKEEGVEVLRDEYDRDAVGSRFPTPEQQALFVSLQGKRIVDSAMHDHCLVWEETDHPVSLSGSLDYLRERMFIKKDMMVIQDERRVRQLALALYRYRSGNIQKSLEDHEWIARHDVCMPVTGLSFKPPSVVKPPPVAGGSNQITKSDYDDPSWVYKRMEYKQKV